MEEGGPPIRAVFFDSGHTLVRPLDGAWFPGHRFASICAEQGVAVDPRTLESALDDAGSFLDEHHNVCTDVSTELAQFTEYYRILLADAAPDAPTHLPALLANEMVLQVNFEPYPRTRATLDALRRRGLPMALITDAWPSVRTKYRIAGLYQYFDAFVVSGEQGQTKPSDLMFAPALEAIGATAAEVLFVDDAPDLVEAAARMGLQSLLADFDGYHRDHPRRIERIEEVLDWI